MPSNIVNLDELVGDDLVFSYRGKEYPIPGDPSTDVVFGFLKLYDDLLEAQQDQAKRVAAAEKKGEDPTAAVMGSRESVQKIIESIRSRLLDLFREGSPDMKDLPFGHAGTMVVLRHVLGMLGVTVSEPEADPPAPAAAKKAPPKRATSVKKKPVARKG